MCELIPGTVLSDSFLTFEHGQAWVQAHSRLGPMQGSIVDTFSGRVWKQEELQLECRHPAGEWEAVPWPTEDMVLYTEKPARFRLVEKRRVKK